MKNFYYVVTVCTETQEQADEVMQGRIGHDDDYGFDYQIQFASSPWTDEEE